MRALAAVAGTIACCDLLQPLVLGWEPRMVAALAGAAIYLAVAAGALGGRRWAAWTALAMPVIPIGALLAGLEPSAAMLGVMGLQIVAAGLGGWEIRRSGP